MADKDINHVEDGPRETDDRIPAISNVAEVAEVPPQSVDQKVVELEGATSVYSFWTSVLRAEAPAAVLVTAEDYARVGPLACIAAAIDNSFRISDRGSSFYYEFTGGMTTFFSMCYIMVVNSVIIAGPFNTGLSVNGVFFATTVSSGIFTFLMGLMVNLPVALAPGMGLNGFFATIAPACPANPQNLLGSTPCPGWGETSLPWSDAMGAVFLSGIFYLFFTMTGLRSMLFTAVPKSLRASITVGIGFFITIIGLTIGEITRVSVAGWAIAGPITAEAECVYGTSGIAYCPKSVDMNYAFYNLGIAKFNLVPPARIAVLGLVFVSVLESLKVKGSIIISIVLATFIGINYYGLHVYGDGDIRCHSTDPNTKCVTKLSAWNNPTGSTFIVDMHNIPSGKLTFEYANKPFFWECVWTFLFVELFDSFGTLTGIMTRAGFMKGDPELAMTRVNRAMCIDGFGLSIGGLLGANSITCYIESNTGVEAGARTGLASIVTGSAFLLSLLFVQPFVGIIPDSATTCALVMVGVHSLVGMKDINFDDFIDQLVAFFTIATMGFTYSIANGICAGFIFFSWLRTVRWVQLKIATYYNKLEEWGPIKGVETDLPHPMMLLMACFMAVRFSFLAA